MAENMDKVTDEMMEKIELVKDRTGASFKEAKLALEDNDYSVVDAIIAIEEIINADSGVNIKEKTADIIIALKELVKKGNASRIAITNKDGEKIVNIPVNVSIIGAIVAPWGLIVGVIAAFGFDCKIEVIMVDGSSVDVSSKAVEYTGKAYEKGSEYANIAKEKSADTIEKVKNSDAYEKVVDTVNNSETINKVMDIALEIKDKAMEKAEEAIDKAGDVIQKKSTSESVNDIDVDVVDSEEVEFEAEMTVEDLSKLTKADLTIIAESMGVEIPKSAKKDEMIKAILK
ncbi:MAG: DUF4342 domain-containing protein [Anaerovoracaceae bacterium]